MQEIKVGIFESVGDAPNWKVEYPEVKPATLHQALIVRNGTTAGNDTVDLVFTDCCGNTYVAMITAKLLKTVTELTITDKALPGSVN